MVWVPPISSVSQIASGLQPMSSIFCTVAMVRSVMRSNISPIISGSAIRSIRLSSKPWCRQADSQGPYTVTGMKVSICRKASKISLTPSQVG